LTHLHAGTEIDGLDLVAQHGAMEGPHQVASGGEIVRPSLPHHAQVEEGLVQLPGNIRVYGQGQRRQLGHEGRFEFPTAAIIPRGRNGSGHAYLPRMHLLLLASVAVQVFLAVHAYRHGRLSPWVWLILFFPLVGSLLYVVLFIVPEASRPRRRARPARDELTVRRVKPGPFAARGDRPDNAIVVDSPSEIEPRVKREDCPDCGHDAMDVEEHRADTIAGRRLRVIVSHCRRCGANPVRYFALAA